MINKMGRRSKQRLKRISTDRTWTQRAKNKAPEINSYIKNLKPKFNLGEQSKISEHALKIVKSQPTLPIDQAVLQAVHEFKKSIAKKRNGDNDGNLPAHIAKNIERVENADHIRKQRGGSLPKREKVSGGRVSPR